jgi:L-alanine-DL-glutamate epimerase-like enolase superfamily enzyme
LIRERAQLRAGHHLALIGDDSCFSMADLQRELSLDTFDILNIKCARTGYTMSKKMLTLAKQHNKGVMVGSQASAAFGAARHALFAAVAGINYPSETTFFLKMKSDIVNRIPSIKEGYITLHEAMAVQIDESRLKAHQI